MFVGVFDSFQRVVTLISRLCDEGGVMFHDCRFSLFAVCHNANYTTPRYRHTLSCGTIAGSGWRLLGRPQQKGDLDAKSVGVPRFW